MIHSESGHRRHGGTDHDFQKQDPKQDQGNRLGRHVSCLSDRPTSHRRPRHRRYYHQHHVRPKKRHRRRGRRPINDGTVRREPVRTELSPDGRPTGHCDRTDHLRDRVVRLQEPLEV